MKRIFYFSIVVFLVFVFSSCGNGSSKSEKTNEFQNSLTSADTTAMLEVANKCMDLLKSNKLDDAMTLLYEYDDSLGQVSPLSEITAAKYKHLFKVFPVLDYTIVYYSFQLEGLNDVKYKVKFAENLEDSENPDAFTSFMFNPVKVGETWYLTVKRADQEIDMTY